MDSNISLKVGQINLRMSRVATCLVLKAVERFKIDVLLVLRTICRKEKVIGSPVGVGVIVLLNRNVYCLVYDYKFVYP